MDELRLLQDVADGGEGAWEAFWSSHGLLVQRVVRATLKTGDADEIGEALAFVMTRLRRRRWTPREGVQRFDHFLASVVRNACIDWLRSQGVRRSLPRRVRSGSELQRKVYVLWWDGRPAAEIVESLQSGSPPGSASELQAQVDAFLDELEAELGHLRLLHERRRGLRRPRPFGAPGPSSGEASPPAEAWNREPASGEFLAGIERPDLEALRREREAAIEELEPKLRQALQELGETERQVLVRLFYEGQKPREIAQALGRTPRDIYNAERNALRRLRTCLRQFSELAQAGLD